MKPVEHSLAVTDGEGRSVTFKVPAAEYCAKVATGIVMVAVLTPPFVALEQFTAPVSKSFCPGEASFIFMVRYSKPALPASKSPLARMVRIASVIVG